MYEYYVSNQTPWKTEKKDEFKFLSSYPGGLLGIDEGIRQITDFLKANTEYIFQKKKFKIELRLIF